MNLAIKGHSTRGKEVIEILEMLGGINRKRLAGTDHNSHYTIDNDGTISGSIISAYLCKCDNHVYYTIEEFLEKFPYKVGDKVQFKVVTFLGPVYEIEQMKWEDGQVKYIICDLYWKNIKCTVTTEDLQPYKEETMEEQKKNYEEWFLTDYLEFENNDDTWADEVEVNLGKDYEIQIRGDKTFIVKKKSQYPKTYEECCKVLGTDPSRIIVLSNRKDIIHEENKHCYEMYNLYQLLICRNAYWRMAGDWKYDVNKVEDYFFIVNKCGRIVKEHYMSFNHILAFPTAEMRDAFFENFKELIEICKELL